MHWTSAFFVFLGSWISGFFIIVTDAWMQHPVAYERLADGQFQVLSFWRMMLNPWGLLQYAHNMTGSVITSAFVMSAVGAFYLLAGRHENYARIFLKVGVIAGVISSILIIVPTGDLHGKYVARHQPAAMDDAVQIAVVAEGAKAAEEFVFLVVIDRAVMRGEGPARRALDEARRRFAGLQ